MFSILIIWAIALVVFAILGHASLRLLYGGNNIFVKDYDTDIVFGMCICNLYGQVSSIFVPVGAIAFIGVMILTIVAGIYLFFRKDMFFGLGTNLKSIKNRKISFICFAIVFSVALWTVITPQHYDTYLYHAQAIRWIEEYGIVPGLGNLHYRFAYNSSYMTLQALFSFKWLAGQSFHVMSGFITVFMLLYVLNTVLNREDKRIKSSDLFKLASLVYILYDCRNISSPNTDTVALLLAYYILIKWSEYSERDDKDVLGYSMLCILLVYVTTIKLSVGIFILLVIYPAVMLIKEKRIADIFKHLTAGVVILIPYIVRGIIISGYILYPYEATAVKSLDWIMPEFLLEIDKKEIIAWGRGHSDVSRIPEHIWQWFGGWFSSINILWKVFMIISIVALIYLGIWTLRQRKRVSFSPQLCMTLTCIIGLFFWLLSAPLPRYGVIYMTSIPCLAISVFLLDHEIKLDNEKILGFFKYTVIGVYIIIFIAYSYVFDLGIPKIIRQSDYDNKPTYTVSSSGIDYAIPSELDLAGYDPFPETPHANTAELIKLRGNDLKDGFKY